MNARDVPTTVATVPPPPDGRTSYVTMASPGRQQVPLPGQAPLVGAALAIGILLLAIQLWLLTVALDLFLAGNGGDVWLLALVSGLIFVGGLVVLWALRRRPHVRRPSGDEAAFAVGAWGSPPGLPPSGE